MLLTNLLLIERDVPLRLLFRPVPTSLSVHKCCRMKLEGLVSSAMSEVNCTGICANSRKSRNEWNTNL